LETDIESGDILERKFQNMSMKKTKKTQLLKKKWLPTGRNPPKNNHTGGFKLTKRADQGL
jgi:hypothetical protein